MTYKPFDLLAEALTTFERNHDGDAMVGGVPIRAIIEGSLEKLRACTFGGDALERATAQEQLRRAEDVLDALSATDADEGLRKAA